MTVTNKINVNTIWVMIDCLLYKNVEFILSIRVLNNFFFGKTIDIVV